MKILFFIALTSLILAGCAPVSVTPVLVDEGTTVQILPSITVAVPTKTTMPSVTPASTVIPTLTPTLRSPKDFNVSSILTQTPLSPAQCPNQDNTLIPDFSTLFNKDTMFDPNTERDIEQPILDFLNAGGSPQLVIDAFNKKPGENVFTDVTNDNVPELIINDFLLHVFGCQNGQYVLLLKVVPSTGPNIQDSNLVFIQDMNLNGIPDLVISEWIAINLYIPDTYRIMEWDGTQFKDLIIQPDFESRYGAGGARDGQVWIDGTWSYIEATVEQVEIADIDKNGTVELILRGGLPGHPDTQRNGPWRGEINIYMWNGDGFVIHSVEPAPPVYRFQAVQDADYAFFDGDYDKAVALYQDVIFSDKLDWWSTDRWIHTAQTLDAINLGISTPTPLPPDNTEYNYLSAYARYRIMLIYVTRGWVPEAKVIYETLREQYPVGKEGHVFTELATIFWDEFLNSSNLSVSCSKTVEFVDQNIFEIFNYVGSVKTDGAYDSYDWTYRGWQKTHIYTVDDICPF